MIFPPDGTGAESVSIVNTSRDEDFTLLLVDPRISDDDGGVFHPGDGWPDELVELDAEESLTLEVLFDGDPAAEHTGTLLIDTNTPHAHIVEIPLKSPESTPDVIADTDELDFDWVMAGETEEQQVELINIGPGPVQIDDVYVDGGDDSFAVAHSDDWNPDDGESAQLDADASMDIAVGFTPGAEEEYSAELVVELSDAATDSTTVELIGHGFDNCPEAHATVSTDETDPADLIEITTGAEIELSGADSVHPDGKTIETYQWSVVDQPAMELPGVWPSDEMTTSTWLSRVGYYQFELMVYDEDGIPACEPATVGVETQPVGDVHIELAWQAVESDSGDYTGADLDLYYLHSDGDVWSDPACDYCIYYDRHGRDDDDPFGDDSDVYLTIDSLTGAQPEVIVHSDLADEPTYSAGVHYFSDPIGLGAVNAQLRVIVDNNVLLDETRLMENPGPGAQTGDDNPIVIDEGDFWHVADIEVENGTTVVEFVDQFYADEGFPE